MPKDSGERALNGTFLFFAMILDLDFKVMNFLVFANMI